MNLDQMSIGELADAGGVSRRAVRFYVMRGLLAAPGGVGRGRHYGREHLEQLKRIKELQGAGYSLEGIRSVLEGKEARPVRGEGAVVGRVGGGAGGAEVWTRIRVMEGVEVHIDLGKRGVDADVVAAIREAVGRVMVDGKPGESERSGS